MPINENYEVFLFYARLVMCGQGCAEPVLYMEIVPLRIQDVGTSWLYTVLHHQQPPKQPDSVMVQQHHLIMQH